MTTIGFDAFPKEEQEAFRQACSRHGFDPGSFLIEAGAHHAGGGSIQEVAGRVSVRRLDVVREYRSAHSLVSWTVVFEDDLRSGTFGG
jgi:hypothetical protein